MENEEFKKAEEIKVKEIDLIVKELHKFTQEKDRLKKEYTKAENKVKQLKGIMLEKLVSINKKSWEVENVGKTNIVNRTWFSIEYHKHLVEHFEEKDLKNMIKINAQSVQGYLREELAKKDQTIQALIEVKNELLEEKKSGIEDFKHKDIDKEIQNIEFKIMELEQEKESEFQKMGVKFTETPNVNFTPNKKGGKA